jgi:hypothetical protein
MMALLEWSDEEEIEHLIRQRKTVKRLLELIGQIRAERSTTSNVYQDWIEEMLENCQFYVYRTGGHGF